ncbi:MAG: hypothetical protein Q8K92_21940, partial [Leadbetterella sp.]|nr:hypothetical protein [Leadbetterella sp.]
AIAEQHEKKIQENEKGENESFLSRTLQFLDSLDGKENLLDIVIKATRKFFELLSTSGEFLSTPEPISVRGDAGNAEKQLLRIIKEFNNPPLSVQVVIGKEDESVKITLTLSLYDPIKENFVSGQFVTLSGPEGEKMSISNETGEVFFDLKQPGNYQFTIGDKEKPDAQLGLNILSE